MASRIFRNIWLKISALILAVLTWWGVHNSMETSESFTYTVRLFLPPNIKAKEVSPETFRVTVTGPNEAVKAFRSTRHIYIIDLGTVKENETAIRIVDIDQTAIDIPPSLSIAALSDEKVTITLDPLVQKELVVECDITDKPAPGYVIVGKSIRPSRIPWELPFKDSKSISRIMTAPVSVSAATANVVDRLALVDPLDSTKRLNVYVDVTIIIQPDFIEKEFKDIPITVLRSPNDRREVLLESEKISVTLRGRRDIMETFDKTKLKVFLDITKQEAGDFDLQPIVQPVEGVASIKTESVKYTIKP